MLTPFWMLPAFLAVGSVLCFCNGIPSLGLGVLFMAVSFFGFLVEWRMELIESNLAKIAREENQKNRA
jgi:hypothetical protein